MKKMFLLISVLLLPAHVFASSIVLSVNAPIGAWIKMVYGNCGEGLKTGYAGQGTLFLCTFPDGGSPKTIALNSYGLLSNAQTFYCNRTIQISSGQSKTYFVGISNQSNTCSINGN